MAASEILIRDRSITVCFESRSGSDVLADENERRVDVREGRKCRPEGMGNEGAVIGY